uniref:Uncharacterized protein n=1 Tax=Panagrolaimus superbus TaxID=310955 RepID=A0A914YJM2_9BILA
MRSILNFVDRQICFQTKDLVTHLTTIHRYSPDDIANVTGNLLITSESPIIQSLSTTLNTTTSSSSGADTSGGGGIIADFGRTSLTTELKQIQKTLNELKSQRNVPHLTQAVNNLDTRIGRMEKQLEMVLNTLYTLVQLQTGNLSKSKVRL